MKYLTDAQGPAHPVVHEERMPDGTVYIVARRHERSFAGEVPPEGDRARYYEDRVPAEEYADERYYPEL